MEAASEAEELWATDVEGHWEVWATTLGGESTLVRGLRQGAPIWDHAVCARVQRLAANGGFVALSTHQELHVLSASSGRLVFPPLVLGSAALHLEVTPRGQLLVLLRDASVIVWDICSESCVAQASLRQVCSPGEVEQLDVKRETGEPFVRLSDHRLLVFQRDLQAWVALAGVGGRASMRQHTSAPGGPTAEPAGSNRRSVSEDARLEGDVLAAACLGDPLELRDRLDALTRHCAQQGDAQKLRGWCASLLGWTLGSSAAWAVLSTQLAGMGLSGSGLLREVVLPALDAVPRAQELRVEVEDALASSECAPSAFSEGTVSAVF